MFYRVLLQKISRSVILRTLVHCKVVLMHLTRAVTHIRLADANAGKLAQLDALADEYRRLCQQYTTAFASRWSRTSMQMLG